MTILLLALGAQSLLGVSLQVFGAQTLLKLISSLSLNSGCLLMCKGSVELRGDGRMHDWTIVNQSPAGAAKFGVVNEALFGIRIDDHNSNPVSRMIRSVYIYSLE